MGNCPKCKNGIVYKTYDYLDDRNVCYICGATHKKGWSYESIEKQVTGTTNSRKIGSENE